MIHSKLDLNDVASRIQREVNHFAKEPHAPVAGTAIVMPRVVRTKPEYGSEVSEVTLQFNGWSITLMEDGIGVWRADDTAAEAANQNESKNEPE